MERSLVEARLGRAIDDAVAAPCVRALVAAYYDPEGPFAGATFDGLTRTPENTVVAEDLLAVTALNVRWSPLAVHRLLEPGVTSKTVNALLADVPATVPAVARRRRPSDRCPRLARGAAAVAERRMGQRV